MRVRRICFLGVRTANFEAMSSFVHEILGLEPAWLEGDWAGFPLDSGEHDYLELFGPTHDDANVLTTASDGPIVAFLIDDLVAARIELDDAGTEIIGDVVWAAEHFRDPALEGFGWLFFRAPDENVYALVQEQAPNLAA